MTSPQDPNPAALNRVALAALRSVADGMTLGLGTGRAAEAFITRLGERVRRGMRVRAVATSKRSEELARNVQIDVVRLEEVDRIDVAFDGADEVAPDLALTKGLGGALVRERVVAYEAERFIILVTPEKLVPKLGTRTPIPIEVVPFAASTVARHLRALGGEPATRKKADSFPAVTDNMNWILDTRFPPIDDPRALHDEVRRIPGVVDTGLFVGMADVVLVGEESDIKEMR
jgi:ribose 5-phosphate isomerase A